MTPTEQFLLGIVIAIGSGAVSGAFGLWFGGRGKVSIAGCDQVHQSLSAMCATRVGTCTERESGRHSDLKEDLRRIESKIDMDLNQHVDLYEKLSNFRERLGKIETRFNNHES